MPNFIGYIKRILLSILGLKADADSDVAIRFNAMPEAWVVFFLVLGLAGAAWFLYRTELKHVGAARRLLMSFLRFAVLLLVMALMFEPELYVDQKADRRGVVVMQIDTSASMGLHDRYPVAGENVEQKVQLATGLTLERPSEKTRLELVKRVLQKDNGKLLQQLGEKGELEWVEFSSKARFDAKLEAMNPVGASTDIGYALDSVMDKYRSRKISAIILITDGQHNGNTSWKRAVDRANGEKTPIFTIGVGDERLPIDLYIKSVIADEQAPVKSLLVIKATVEVSLIQPGTQVKVSLLFAPAPLDNTTPDDNDFKPVKGEDGKDKVETKTLNAGQKELDYEFEVRPESTGSFIYRVSVEPRPEEEDLKNNRWDHRIQVNDNRIKVLFIDDAPRYEYRYLRSLLVRNNQEVVAWTCLLKADKEFVQDHTEGKFTDSLGKERVILPLTELPRRGLGPAEEAGVPGLMDFDVVILGDVDPRELPQEFLKDLKTFVMGDEETGEPGGGAFIMIAGERFSPEMYKKTPVEDILPIEITPVDSGIKTSWERLNKIERYSLTEYGRMGEITRLVADVEENEKLWAGDEKDPYEGLGGFYWFYPVVKTKAVATVLVRHATAKIPDDQGERYPLIVTGHAGSGQTMFIALDGLWRWKRGVGDRYYQKFWSQALHKLTGGKFLKSKRLSMEVVPTSVSLGEPVAVKVTILDESLEPEGGKWKVRYQVRDGRTLEASLEQKGKNVYEKNIIPGEIGQYRIWVEDEKAASAEERKLGQRQFAVNPIVMENKNPNMNLALLKDMARGSEEVGGQFRYLHEMSGTPQGMKGIPELIDKYEERVVMERAVFKPHTLTGLAVAVLALFMLLITAEWLLRKREKLI